jgi:succinate dehydrogenase / fumarate reductase cytochrome b subunit
VFPLLQVADFFYKEQLMSSSPSSSKKSACCCWPLLSSSIGRKWIVAITGIVLVLFVIGHLLGNLSIFLGPDAINAYALFLQSLGEILWLIRIVLLACVVLHIWFTIALWRENRAARPQKYAVKNDLQTTVYARLMRLSGLTVLAFILFHLAEFTWQAFTPEYRNWVDAQGRHDVYRMVIAGFSNPFVTGFYMIAIGLLAMHLSHGIASLFQTLGITTAKMRPLFERAGRIVAWVIFVGYVSIPLAVFFGILSYPHVARCSLCH